MTTTPAPEHDPSQPRPDEPIVPGHPNPEVVPSGDPGERPFADPEPETQPEVRP
ncbi:hypothetical protein ISU10_02860 [Nocardioides agariphilus]|jgi:hypothetical protein|uniref:Uncharacterized protein n=1 Tax=Nocardioides agariphilus TaxID=433664 RepID=A0A930VMR8_9ACTN|nr:hypothetical protein [Nocardioides agariphilus]MBF4766705.1 hypothetical protein [Nocardioides agariphilus]